MENYQDVECPTVTSLCHCIFQYLGEEGPTIRGLHTTPLMSFVDTFNFTLTDGSGGLCYVKVSYLNGWCTVG